MLLKEYRPIDSDVKRVYSLSGNTPKTEKALRTFKLVVDTEVPPEERTNPDEEFQGILNGAGQRLIDLCNVIFKGEPKFTIKDIEEIDRSIVREAMLDFFYRDIELLERYNNSFRTSAFSKTM